MTFNQSSDWIATSSFDWTVRLSDAQTGALLASETAGTFQLEPRKDDRQLAFIQRTREFNLLEVAPRDFLRTLHSPAAPTANFWLLVFSPDGRFLASGEEAGIRFWDVGMALSKGVLPRERVNSAIFSGDGGSILTIGDEGIFRCSLEGLHGSPDLTLARAPERVYPDAHLVQASPSLNGQTLAIKPRPYSPVRPERPVANKDHRSQPGRPFCVTQLGRTDDCRRWMACYGGWSASSGRLITNFPTSSKASATFSPGGRWLAVSSKDVQLYETATWTCREPLKLTQQQVSMQAVAFSHDNRQ